MSKKMKKTVVILAGILALSACSPELTKEAAVVTVHTQKNKLLDGCKRLGQVKDDYEVKMTLNLRENKIQAQNDLKQKAYENYYADNILLISSNYVKGGFGEKPMIYGRAIAYRCELN